MKHRLATKSLLLLVGLFVVFYAHGQNGLSPYKLTIFQDAAQVGWKGIVRFHQQSAEVPLAMNVNANGMDLIPGTSDVQIKSFRVRQDTLITQSLVQNWADVLRANISRKVTILYVIGNEYDEVSGSVRLINDLAGMLLLRGIDNSEYFIPLDEIKQVVVQGKSDFKIDQKTLQDVLEINLSKDVPFVPMEMFTLDPNIHWKPVCRIRILGSDKALLQMLALIQNGENALKDVDVDLSTANMLTQAGSDAEIIEMGNISLDPGDELMVNFRETQLTYQRIYRSSIAWNESYLDGKGHIFPVNNTLQFALPAESKRLCTTYSVTDENNRNIANLSATASVDPGKIALNMGQEKQILVTLTEGKTSNSRKTERIGNLLYDRVSVEGKITCQNIGQKFIQLNMDRAVKGEVVEANKAKISNSPRDKELKLMRWKLALDKGQKKVVTYKYDALILHQGD